MSGLHEGFSKKEKIVWDELAERLHELEEAWDGSPQRIEQPPFTVTFDVHTEPAGRGSYTITRLRAAYVNRDGFRFQVKRHDWLSDVKTLLGAQDVEVGAEDFDREWIVKSNSSSEAKKFLQDGELRRLLQQSSRAQSLEVRDHEGWFGPEFPDEVDELYLEADGRVTEPAEVEKLYEIFARALSRLCQIGSAYERDPHLEL